MRPRPDCARCRGTGITHDGGTPKKQIQCPCAKLPAVDDVASLTQEANLLRGRLVEVEAKLAALRSSGVDACVACLGLGRVELGGMSYPCPAACAASGGATS